jgi:hypothetical protein
MSSSDGLFSLTLYSLTVSIKANDCVNGLSNIASVALLKEEYV